MPDIKHNFTGGKMNKDLNERLVPNGEYRDAMNIQVQTSEGSEVGTIQNILGNNFGCDYTNVVWDNPIPSGSTTVGSVSDEKNDSLYWLISGNNDSTVTDWTTVTTVKDIIMRTNPSNITGCEPVFVDTYGFSTVNLETSDVNALNITGSLIDQLDYGYTVTGITASGDTSNTATVISFDSGETYNLEWELVPTTTASTMSAPFCMAGASPMCNCTGMNLLGGALFSGGWSYFTTNKLYLSGCSSVTPADWIGGNITLFAGTVDEQTFTITNAQNVSVEFASGQNQNMVGITLDSNILDVSGNLATGLVFSASGLIDSITGSSTSGGSSMTSQFLGNPMGATGTITLPPTVVSAPSGWIDIPIPPDPGGYDVNNFIIGDSISINMFSGGYAATYCVCAVGSTSTSGNAIQIATPDPSNPGSCLSDCGLVAAPFVNTGISYWVTGGTFTIGDEIFANLDTTLNLGLDTYTSLIWEGPRVLNFNHGNLITGINIVDDMLFWTDGYHDANNKLQGTEPKKININRSIQGTNVAGATHTDLYVDGINEGPIREKHVTVIRKAPLGPPTLEMTSQIREGILGGVDVVLFNQAYDTTSNTYTPTIPFTGVEEGDTRWVVIGSVNGEHPNFESGDILRIQAIEVGAEFDLPSDYHLRLEVVQKEPGPFDVPLSVISVTGDETAYQVRILTVADESKLNELDWYVELEEGDNLFERKFPRFAYRYKYVDNEYSSFGPFSEVAFIPGNFDYAPIEAYNIGMTNRVKSLIIKDFVSNDTPKDVVQVDILYKNETSPTVYLLDSVARNDSTNNWNTSSYEVSTESVFTALPTSQTLRSWDNVPRTAKAQEVTGNRLVYGNYLQGYDITQALGSSTILQPSITTTLASRIVDSEDFTGKQSIKSLRTYDVGVVWGDKYGRETPVITSPGSSLTVPKSKSLDSSYLLADIGASPHWADYYRFYVKETSNEYYNMPVDRVYDADDGNIWVSFPSVDRNKVDEDTYIILKKGIDSDSLILEDARYKIVAIENEAPEYIKTTFERLIRSNTDSSRQPDSCNMYGGSTSFPCTFASGRNAPDVGRKGFSLKAVHWSADYNTTPTTAVPRSMGLTSPFVLWNEVKDNSGNSTTDELYVSFTQEITSTTTGETTVTESSKYHVVSVEEVFDTDGKIIHYYVNLKTPILPSDGFIVGNGDMANDNMHQHFWKKTIRNKPEFDGRFFVKILNDTTSNKNLKTKVGLVGNWRIDTSLKLYKIDDSKLSISGPDYNYANTSNPSTTTKTQSHWNTILKFGGSSTKSEWFIDGASFASKQLGTATDTIGNYANVKTDFPHPSSGTIDSCDLTSSYPQTLSGECTVYTPFPINIPLSINLGDAASIVGTTAQLLGLSLPSSFGIDVGDGSSEGLVGMKGVHETASAKYFDLAHSKIGPTGATGNTTFYNLEWDEADNEAEVVANLKPNKRFRLQGDTDGIIYKIDGVTRHRIFNYQGKKTANPSSFGSSNGFPCGKFWNTKQDNQVGLMGDQRNRRVTYRIRYEVDVVSLPDPDTVCTNPSNPFTGCPKLSDNSVYGNIDNLNSVNLQFIEEFTTEGENPISKNPAIFETEPKEDVDLDLYYEASSSLPTFPITERNKHLYIPVGATIIPPPTGSSSTIFPEGVFITGWQYIDPISPSYTINLSTPLTTSEFSFLTTQPYLVLLKDNGEIIQAEIIAGPMSGGLVVGIRINPISSIGLSWFNCWSFNNGVESNRVGDTFNKPFLTNGATVSTTTEERFKEEHRKYGLIYSGLYNSNSGVNSLNQFIQAEKITKDINPTYGSIQKLHSGWGQGGDLVTLCEDRILKILANKDALYNADGDSNVTSTNSVLGQAIPYSGEFGISKNPESFASDAYRAYFTDKVRGTVMRLSMDGLTPISEHGMKDWFRDNLKLNNDLVGSYDDRQDKYNITLPITTEQPLPSILTARTVSFSERAKGWVSFKSFVPENGISCANNYYTFKDGNLYKHHDETVDRNTFYPTVGIPGNYTDSSFTVLINESPGTVKTFHTLNYEGSQSKIDQLVTSTGTIGAYDTFLPTNPSVVDTTYNSDEYYNLSGEDGWYVHSIKTDLEEGSLNEFIEKEGKWFNYIKGIPGSITDGVNANGFSNYNISFQGLGRMAGSASVSSIFGCTDCGTTDSSTTPIYTYPDSTNCDPAATVDNGSCNDTIVGCTDPLATVNYDPTANWDIWANTGVSHPGACQYHGCTDPLATNYDPNANYNDGSCNYPVIGCMDTTATNYDVANDTACDGTNDLLQPCIADASGIMQTITSSPLGCCCNPAILGCTDPLADNYEPAANTDDGSCFNIFSGCMDGLACNYDDLANTDDGSCTYCDDDSANNYDGLNPDGSGNTLADCDDGCVFCKDPVNFQTTGNVSTGDIEVSWDEVIIDAPVNVYKIRYKETSCSGSGCWTTSIAGAGGVNGNTINYGISGLSPNTSYDIQLKAVCVAGQSPHNPAHYTATAWSNTLTGSTLSIPIPGCTDDQGFNNPIGSWPACNYNPLATVDDSSCEYVSCTGCTNPAYQEYCGDCWDTSTQTVVASGGSAWLGDDGSCSTPSLTGCTDSTAVNYDATATIDDGSCIAPIYGCTDNTTLDYSGNLSATNYDPLANSDDGSCTYTFNLSGSWVPYNDPAVNSSYADGWVFVLEAPGIPTGASPSTLEMSLNGNPFAASSYGYNVNSATTIESQLQSNLTADLMHVSNSSLTNSDTWQFSSWDSLATLSWVLPNIGLIEQDLVDAIQLIPGCMDSTNCFYNSSATYEWAGACTNPLVGEGCMDSTFDSYDPLNTCNDPDMCWNCATDPGVASAYAAATSNPNVYRIKWPGIGGISTNYHNGENYSGTLDISTKRAYTVRFRYKIGSSPWTAYAAYEPPTTDFFGELTFCSTKQSAGSNASGFPIGQTYIPWVTNGSGAYASGVKWQFEVQNECNNKANCATGPVVTTPEITLS